MWFFSSCLLSTAMKEFIRLFWSLTAHRNEVSADFSPRRVKIREPDLSILTGNSCSILQRRRRRRRKITCSCFFFLFCFLFFSDGTAADCGLNKWIITLQIRRNLNWYTRRMRKRILWNYKGGKHASYDCSCMDGESVTLACNFRKNVFKRKTVLSSLKKVANEKRARLTLGDVFYFFIWGNILQSSQPDLCRTNPSVAAAVYVLCSYGSSCYCGAC